MKMNISLIIFLITTSVTGVYGNYKSMTESVDAYLPPQQFSESLMIKEKTGNEIPEAVENLSVIVRQIKDIRRDFEMKISMDQPIEFLSHHDEALFKKLTRTAGDPDAITGLLKHHFSLETIELLAAFRNPAILAAQNRIRAEIESFNQIMNLDDILKRYSAFSKGLNNNIGPLKMNSSVQSIYPYPGLTSLKGQVATAQVSLLVESMKIVQKTIITDIRKSYWELVFNDTSTKITSETLAAFNRLKDVATALYRSGKTNFQDVIKINIKTALLKEDLVTLSVKRKNIEVRILELLNMPLDVFIGTPLRKTAYKKIPTPEKLYSMAENHRQELDVIRLSILKKQTMIELAESMILSPFSFNLSLYRDDPVLSTGTGAEKPSFPEKTMSAMKNNSPVKPWYGINDPWLKETKLTLSALKQTLEKEENKTDTKIRQGWFEMDKSRRELELYSAHIGPLSESARDVSTRGYESGSLSFADAIDSYTYWLNVKLLIAQKQKDLGTGIAKLEMITGKSF